MKLKNSEISNYAVNLQNISTKVKGKLAYIVARNLRKLVTEIQEYEEIKNSLIEKYGSKDENGILSVTIGSDEYKEFIKEISEYATIEQDIDLLMISPDDLYETELTAQDILSIDFMIEETTE